MRIKVNDFIAAFLHAQKIEYVFEVAGGMITNLLDAIYRLGKTNIISVHHEQAAAFAADAYGRVTGKPGVALATSGPGATNLLTGIASCYFDSSPAIFITGQVNTHEQKGKLNIRQLGFQETDIIAMATPILKKSFRIETADQIETMLMQAYESAISDRPGPVLIDIPMNIQGAEITVSPINLIKRKINVNYSLEFQINSLNECIQKAKRPLILLGGGVRCASAVKEALKFIELTQIPVVTSLLALDIIEFDHPLRVGFIGTYGNRWANLAISRADLLVVIGSRLDVRQTGADINGFAKDKTVFHIDCDENEINNRVKGCIPIVSDLKDFLVQANNHLQRGLSSSFPHWLDQINLLKKTWPDIDELKMFPGINPNIFMHILSKFSKEAAGYVVDVGSHQMWAAQSLELGAHQVFMTSGGMGAMGFSLPAAIGTSLACGKKPIVVIVGDGSFQMNIQELQTVVRNNIPLKIIVINNNCLGMIRQFQDSYFDGRYQSTYWGYTAPNFEHVAIAYNLAAKTIYTCDEMEAGVKWLWGKKAEPALLQVMVSSKMNVYPKIAFGRPISEMEPLSCPLAMEST